MKRCPTCNQTFNDRNLSFCIDDGTPLLVIDDPPDEVTVVSPSPGSVPPYQSPGAYASPGLAPPKRKAWPWILGLLLLLVLVVGGMATAGWFYFRSLERQETVNANTSNSNANVNSGNNSNRNSNNWNSNSTPANQNLNQNSDALDATPAPTDQAVVLGDLTDLEHQWTVANINADKKKLNQILADDYVGTSSEGKAQGKGDYLRTIQRDTRIQKWKFDNLEVSLKGDRATLTGTLRLKIEDQDVAYRFVDKFVWREGRWQATSSEVSELKEDRTTI